MSDGPTPGAGTGGRGEVALFPSLDRFNAFSDGVFAIAITLLVLELPVPPENVAVLPALQASWRDFLAYLMSFAVIGGIWLTHATLTKVMKSGDSIVYGVNLLLLLFVATLPFSTRLMAVHLGTESVGAAVAIYGLNVLLASLTLSAMLFYVAREPALVVDRIADDRLRSMYRRRWVVLVLNLFALAMAFLAPSVAVGLYLVTTILMLALPMLALMKKRRRSTAAA
jgi:uncharacterized membrane protein